MEITTKFNLNQNVINKYGEKLKITAIVIIANPYIEKEYKIEYKTITEDKKNIFFYLENELKEIN